MSDVTTVDLASWLTAIWDEEERLAKAVGPLRDVSTMAGPMQQKFTHSRLSYASEDAYPRSESDPAASRHFNRHDPASVLARIAADRKILELHGVAWNAEVCTVCYHPHEDGETLDNDARPCETVRLLASPYKGREGWQGVWE